MSRRRILSLLPAVEGTRAMMLAKDNTQPEWLRVVCWAHCEELAEAPILGAAAEPAGPTVVVAMVVHITTGKLVFVDALPRFVGVAEPGDTDASWQRLIANAARERAQAEAQLIEKAEEVVEKAVAYTARPPSYHGPPDPIATDILDEERDPFKAD